jgi:hypothetical protein
MPKALQSVYKYSAGIPRVINLLCDRALLAAYSERALRVTPEMIRKGAGSLDLAPRVPRCSGGCVIRRPGFFEGISHSTESTLPPEGGSHCVRGPGAVAGLRPAAIE